MRASSRDDVLAWRSAQARRTSASTDRHVSARMLMLRHVLQAASTGLPLHDSKTAARMDVGGVDDIVYKIPLATGSEPAAASRGGDFSLAWASGRRASIGGAASRYGK